MDNAQHGYELCQLKPTDMYMKTIVSLIAIILGFALVIILTGGDRCEHGPAHRVTAWPWEVAP